MKTKLVGVAALAATALAVAAVSAAAAPKSATFVIHHQLHGCHAWALNGGAYKVSQMIHLAKGGSLTVTDNDIMSHQLIKTSGPAVTFRLVSAGAANTGKLKPPYATGLMPHMGATVTVSFPKAGVYKLTTKEGDDYFPGIKTIGADNILHATVIVS